MPAPTNKDEVRRFPRCCNLPFTVLWIPVNQVRTTKNIAEERHWVYLGTKRAESFWRNKSSHFLCTTAEILWSGRDRRSTSWCLIPRIRSLSYARWSAYKYAWRALTETEKRNSEIEKEMLSIVYSLTRFHIYTYGRKVTVYNDHKPLASILKKPVEDNPVTFQRMLCRIMGCDLEFNY